MDHSGWNNTIIAVDDEDGILDFYRQVLAPQVADAQGLRRARRRTGAGDDGAQVPDAPRFRLLTASSGEDALALAETEYRQGRRIAAGFFDMKMPGGMDGLETIRALRKIDPRVMCAVVTAFTDRTITQIASCFENQDEWIYFNKPFTEWELLQAARNLVSGWNVRRQREAAMLELERSNLRIQQAHEQLAGAYLATVRAFCSSLEARDPYTAGHSQRVAHFASELALKLTIPTDEVERMRTGFLLHDVGKIGIPDAVLKKPGSLTDDERAQIKLHPTIGVELLTPIGSLDHVLCLVKHHHEAFDGRGYPDGLRGQSIPLGARILAVADTFDALTSSRCYRRACTLNGARDILLSCRGTQHDPEVCDAFLAIIREEPERIISAITPEGRQAPPEADVVAPTAGAAPLAN